MPQPPPKFAVPATRSIVDVTAGISMIVASGVMVWAVAFRGPGEPPDHPAIGSVVSLVDASTSGAATAPVVVVEFVDFECPSCRTFATSVMPRLVEAFVAPGLVQIAYRHFPLVDLHTRAFDAAVTSYCAGLQGKFLPVHDAFFRHGVEVDSVARTLSRIDGLNPSVMAECQRLAGVKAVERDIADGRRLAVSGTPVFLVAARTSANEALVRHVVQGAQPFERFDEAIRDVLATVGQSVDSPAEKE